MIGNFKLSLPPFVAVLLLILITSCEKEPVIIEQQLVVSKIDKSIDTDADIMDFDIVDENTFFAIGRNGSTIEIHKTSNGGTSWTSCATPIASGNIQGIAFLDALNGIVVINDRAYRTYDGALSWSSPIVAPYGSGNYASDFVSVGKTENDEFILLESNENSWYDNHIFTSTASGTTYTEIFSHNHSGERFDYGHYINGKYFYLTRDFNGWEYEIYMFDINTLTRDTIGINHFIVRDAIYDNGQVVVVSEDGKIHVPGSYDPEDRYNYHANDYNSIETMGSYYVAVANRSISCNYYGNWEEAWEVDGTGHEDEFFKVKRLNNNRFCISGDNGLFINASLE